MKALITGITGQDGAYLAKLLTDKGYEVIGARRHSASPGVQRLEALGVEVRMVPFELLEYSNVQRVIQSEQFDEVYNLAAVSYVATTFEQPIYTGEVNGLGVARLLEAIRLTSAQTRFYQASTSEMFGLVRETPQNELTPFYPRSPYAAAKLYAHCMTVNAREAWGLHASSGILFNHESPLRGIEFVTKKIARGLAAIVKGKQKRLMLGNLNARRDWGHAEDYVQGMWMMLQQHEADDYVLATGQTHTIREFVDVCAKIAGIDIAWRGYGSEEIGFDSKMNPIVMVDRSLYRPSEVGLLQGDASKARDKLGWAPTHDMESLAQVMMEYELAAA